MSTKEPGFYVYKSTTKGGGFPIDHWFWEKKLDVKEYGEIAFSGMWQMNPKDDGAGVTNAHRYREWRWTKIDKIPITNRIIAEDNTVRTSKDGVKYRVIGFFEDPEKYLRQESCYNQWRDSYDQVIHRSSIYCFAVEILGNEFLHIRGIIKDPELLQNIAKLSYEYVDVLTDHMRYETLMQDEPPKFLNELIYELKAKIGYNFDLEKGDGGTYGSILINRYEGVNECKWHRDFDEGQYCHEKGDLAIRVILTLGPDKIFKIRNLQTQEITEYLISSGDCVIFSENFDECFEHCVPPHDDGKVRYSFMITFEMPREDCPGLFEQLHKQFD